MESIKHIGSLLFREMRIVYYERNSLKLILYGGIIMKKAMIFVIICVLGIGGIMWHKDAMVDNLSEYITNKGLEQAFGTNDYEEIIKNKVMSEKKEVLDVAFSEDENGNHVAYLYLENGNVIINKFDSNWNYIES